MFKDIKLVSADKSFRELCTKPAFQGATIFSNDLCAVEKFRNIVKRDKRTIIGINILEITKYVMLDFYYNVLKVSYGDRVKLLMIDPYSSVSLESEDFYQYMLEHGDVHDRSGFPTNGVLGFLHDMNNSKQTYFFKEELSEKKFIIKFICLRSNMYNYEYETYDKNSAYANRLMGIPWYVVKKKISTKEFEEAFEGESTPDEYRYDYLNKTIFSTQLV